MPDASSSPQPRSSFVPTHRRFVSYIDKSREYYAAHGYEKSYQWAYNDETPFTPLAKPLSQSRVGLVTTSFLHREDRPADWPDSKAKQPYALEVDRAPARMYTDDLAWDKQATHTDDRESFLPLTGTAELVESGRLGSLSPRFYGVPTDYSLRRTMKVDGPAVLELMRSDDVDVALLVPL
jgi:hypothetical protein